MRLEAKGTAWFLACAGFVPFAGLSLALLLVGKETALHPVLTDALRTYAAVVLSFLGGIRWGLALRSTPVAAGDILFSVVPAIVGWLALFLPVPLAVSLLLLAFCTLGAWDSLAIHRGLAPVWFATQRIVLTLLVAAALVGALVAVV